jgi:hypothetical protein
VRFHYTRAAVLARSARPWSPPAWRPCPDVPEEVIEAAAIPPPCGAADPRRPWRGAAVPLVCLTARTGAATGAARYFSDCASSLVLDNCTLARILIGTTALVFFKSSGDARKGREGKESPPGKAPPESSCD